MIDDDIAVRRHLGPIIEPLQKIVDNSSTRVVKNEPDVAVEVPPKRIEVPRALKKKGKRTDGSPDRESSKRRRIGAVQPSLPTENVFETMNDVISRDDEIDRVFGVYIGQDGLMFGNKRFAIDSNDNILIDDVRHKGTPGLYELIFKKHPDEDVYSDNDMQTYRSMLLVMNTYRRDHSARGRVKSNRGYKYKYIIAPLLPSKPKTNSKRELPRAMTLNDNLRLLDASRQTGNNSHDNEMLSIIEELREAGIVIN
ncbi:hypothetical protein X777_11802 [Ooceraea biroi]|uniref:DUF8207 domain-containing protein n=1 Tax=Ooceraea biroi TaxID=2015173 RepID=A0A026W181_OOCBI|nr:hypothetical protein X777_11802 [Ooceraea biroi]